MNLGDQPRGERSQRSLTSCVLLSYPPGDSECLTNEGLPSTSEAGMADQEKSSWCLFYPFLLVHTVFKCAFLFKHQVLKTAYLGQTLGVELKQSARNSSYPRNHSAFVMPLHIVHTQNVFVELINCNVWRGWEGSFNSISKGELSHLSLAKVHNAHTSRGNLMCMKIVQRGTEVAVKPGMQNQNGEFSIRRKNVSQNIS